MKDTAVTAYEKIRPPKVLDVVTGELEVKELPTDVDFVELAEYLDEHWQDWRAMAAVLAFLLRTVAGKVVAAPAPGLPSSRTTSRKPPE